MGNKPPSKRTNNDGEYSFVPIIEIAGDPNESKSIIPKELSSMFPKNGDITDRALYLISEATENPVQEYENYENTHKNGSGWYYISAFEAFNNRNPIPYLELSASRSCAEALYDLGTIYYNGYVFKKGVIVPDIEKAAKYFFLGASIEHPPCLAMAGRICDIYEQFGDESKSLRFLLAASENIKSCRKLSRMTEWYQEAYVAWRSLAHRFNIYLDISKHYNSMGQANRALPYIKLSAKEGFILAIKILYLYHSDVMSPEYSGLSITLLHEEHPITISEFKNSRRCKINAFYERNGGDIDINKPNDTIGFSYTHKRRMMREDSERKISHHESKETNQSHDPVQTTPDVKGTEPPAYESIFN